MTARRKHLPLLQRGCDSCRHDRTRYFHGDFHTPPDVEVGCAVIDDDAPAPGAAALRRFVDNGNAYEHIIDNGGCPAWQAWDLCETHGLPAPPNADYGCVECTAEGERWEQARLAAEQSYWDRLEVG